VLRSTAQQDRDDFIAGEEADLPTMPWDVKMCHWGRSDLPCRFLGKGAPSPDFHTFKLKTYRKGQFLDEVDDLFFHVPKCSSMLVASSRNYSPKSQFNCEFPNYRALFFHASWRIIGGRKALIRMIALASLSESTRKIAVGSIPIASVSPKREKALEGGSRNAGIRYRTVHQAPYVLLAA
jgi:hypothetical protein